MIISGCYSGKQAEDKSATKTQAKEGMGEFAVTSDQEAIFYDRVSAYYGEDELASVRNRLERLKIRYPEGYFIIIKMCSREPQEFEAYYEGDDSSINTIIHEASHGADSECLYDDNVAGTCEKEKNYETYLIDGYLVRFPYDYSLDESFSQAGEAMLHEIKNHTDFDHTYLVEQGSGYSTLDELNSYTKSMRCSKYFDTDNAVSSYEAMQRQLYHLNIMLIYAKTDPLIWDRITSDKAFVTMALKLRDIAMAEEIDPDDYRDDVMNRESIEDAKNTRNLVLETSYILDELDRNYEGYDFTGLKEIGIEAKHIDELGMPGPVPVFAEGENPYEAVSD